MIGPSCEGETASRNCLICNAAALSSDKTHELIDCRDPLSIFFEQTDAKKLRSARDESDEAHRLTSSSGLGNPSQLLLIHVSLIGWTFS